MGKSRCQSIPSIPLLKEKHKKPESLQGTSCTLVYIGDTYGFRCRLTLAPGDILIHSGNFDKGPVRQIGDCNDWLRTLLFRHNLVYPGNHDLLFDRNPNSARAHLNQAIYLQDAGVTFQGLKCWDRRSTRPAETGLLQPLSHVNSILRQAFAMPISPACAWFKSVAVCRFRDETAHSTRRRKSRRPDATKTEVIGFFDNNSLGDVTCTWAFHKHGVWTDEGQMYLKFHDQHKGGESAVCGPKRPTAPTSNMPVLKASIRSMFMANFATKPSHSSIQPPQALTNRKRMRQTLQTWLLLNCFFVCVGSVR